MSRLPYNKIPVPPESITPGTILARVVDGLGFRYRWATEGLKPEELSFRPSPDSRSIEELLHHIYGLIIWVYEHFGGKEKFPHVPDGGLHALRYQTLRLLKTLSKHLKGMTEKELAQCTVQTRTRGRRYPFWYIINGPLLDALTHVGQINGWRRLAGNPVPGADVFRGLPPRRMNSSDKSGEKRKNT
ncbi:DinB family protein [Candidatus Sumerlaeota bacterium]|nr:DinB family protein [Candidatus Sumerlaeota bacterium]